MQIQESFVCGKANDPALCEDGIVITDHLAAIVDGATAKSPRLFGGKRSGRFAMETLVAALERLPAGLSPWQATRALTQALAVAVEAETGVPCAKIPLVERPTASAVVFLKERGQLVFIGDCQALANGCHHFCHENPTDQVVASVRRLRAYALMAQEVGDTPARFISRESIEPMLAESLVFRNRPGTPLSFAALDGTDIPNSLVYVYSVPPGTEVVLASDGYPRLLPTLQASETELARLLLEDPSGLEALRGVGSMLPGNVSFDDRAYLRFTA